MADPRKLLYKKNSLAGEQYGYVRDCFHEANAPFEPKPSPDDLADARDALRNVAKLSRAIDQGIPMDELILKDIPKKEEEQPDPMQAVVRRWFDNIQMIHFARVGGVLEELETRQQRLDKLKELVGNGNPRWLQDARKEAAELEKRMPDEVKPFVRDAIKQMELAFIMVSSETLTTREEAEDRFDQRGRS